MYMNKPKCALFLNGCIRDSIENYCKCITNMLEIFSGEYDIDIYFHTWKSFDKTDISKHEHSYNENDLITELKRFPSLKDVLIREPFTEKYYDMDNLTEFSVEFLSGIIELFIKCEKQTDNAYMFKNMLKLMMEYCENQKDYYQIISHSKRV